MWMEAFLLILVSSRRLSDTIFEPQGHPGTALTPINE